MEILKPTKYYYSFEELKTKWGFSEAEILREIIEGEIKPSVWATGLYSLQLLELNTARDWVESEDNEDNEDNEDDENESQRLFANLDTWLYLQEPRRLATSNCVFKSAAESRDPAKSAEVPDDWYTLPKAMELEEVKNTAVFMCKEVHRYESAHSAISSTTATIAMEKPLSDRERTTLLKIIGILCKQLNFEHKKHSKTAGIIANAADQMGVSIGESTIEGKLKLIDEALGIKQI